MNNNSTIVMLEKDAEKCDKSVKGFTMDEAFLNDLLECSVCLEQLDSSSKVLPCQHTFCKRCLYEILSSHKELRCPECRILVDTNIEQLPCNILLVRLLDGIKNNVRLKKVGSNDIPPRNAESSSSSSSSQQPTFHNPQLSQPMDNLTQMSSADQTMVPKQVPQAYPWNKVLNSYEAKTPVDLAYEEGDVSILSKTVHQNSFYEESGLVPTSFAQVHPISTHVPQCKALYDFKSIYSGGENHLTFEKGDILTVIRRIDDRWAEGKLRDRIGIFPISLVEMNAAARAIMEFSSNPGSPEKKKCLKRPATDIDEMVNRCLEECILNSSKERNKNEAKFFNNSKIRRTDVIDLTEDIDVRTDLTPVGLSSLPVSVATVNVVKMPVLYQNFHSINQQQQQHQMVSHSNQYATCPLRQPVNNSTFRISMSQNIPCSSQFNSSNQAISSLHKASRPHFLEYKPYQSVNNVYLINQLKMPSSRVTFNNIAHQNNLLTKYQSQGPPNVTITSDSSVVRTSSSVNSRQMFSGQENKINSIFQSSCNSNFIRNRHPVYHPFPKFSQYKMPSNQMVTNHMICPSIVPNQMLMQQQQRIGVPQQLRNHSSLEQHASIGIASDNVLPDMSSSSNDMPSSSNDIPSSSNDMPSSSNDMPSSSNDMPSSSNDIPSSSNDMPSSSTDMPSSSTDISSSRKDDDLLDFLYNINTSPSLTFDQVKQGEETLLPLLDDIFKID